MERNGQQTTPPIVRDEGPLATGERLRPFALAALTVVLLALCALLAYPFLPAVTWGVALAVVAWPLHAWILRRITEHRTAAAVLSALVVVLAIVVPGAFVAQQLAREAASAADQMREDRAKDTVRDRLARVPGMGDVVAWADRTGIDIDAEARGAVRSYFGDAGALAQGSVMAVLQAVIAVFILFYMLRDRRELLAGVRRLLPMRRSEADRVFDGAAGSVYANLYASLLTSAIDGFTGGLLFWFLGLPSPVTWGVVIFVLSLLPVAGIFMVWLPAAVYLALVDDWGGAAALVAWGAGCGVLVDTLLYTRLAGARMRLHQVPALIAFLGGIAVFGASGMILGPAILAVTVAVLDVWHHRVTGDEVPAPAEEPAAAAPRPGPVGAAVAPAH
ncbi:MAG: AI-2E family transporter [Planctomycetes bacterium]|nr:AI-2E family transporter [Planctomycetota bacterium]